MNKNGFFILLSILLFHCQTGRETTGEWISLFDGDTLNGWKAGENNEIFTIEDGAIKVNGNRSHLFYTGQVNGGMFKNFEFKADVMTKPGANSGIYICSEYQEEGWPEKGYEVQINNSYVGDPEHPELKKTGGLYGIRNKYLTIVKDNEWFNMHIILKGNRIQTFVNDHMLIDYTEPEDPYRPEDMKQRLIAPGTFALQGHDPGSTVYFKNIMVKPLPDDAKFETPQRRLPRDVEKRITKLHTIGFPLMDLHTHLKGGLTMEEALAQSRYKGIDYGIAINCGLDFNINTDAKLYAYLDSMQNVPAFNAMQAEGREWLNIFSPDAYNTFDYIFTDAMTFNNLYGKRVHLWIPEEVNIPDEEQFMDLLTDYIVKIMNEEPINIYANATYIPDVLADKYDQLWTEERMTRVIQAAVDNGIAIEIGSRYKIPSYKFIRLAKKMGAKFTFGTNNTGPNLGYDEYGLNAIDSCGLVPADMWVPVHKIL